MHPVSAIRQTTVNALTLIRDVVHKPSNMESRSQQARNPAERGAGFRVHI